MSAGIYRSDISDILPRILYNNDNDRRQDKRNLVRHGGDISGNNKHLKSVSLFAPTSPLPPHSLRHRKGCDWRGEGQSGKGAGRLFACNSRLRKAST